jgi:hypothetical protein
MISNTRPAGRPADEAVNPLAAIQPDLDSCDLYFLHEGISLQSLVDHGPGARRIWVGPADGDYLVGKRRFVARSESEPDRAGPAVLLYVLAGDDLHRHRCSPSRASPRQSAAFAKIAGPSWSDRDRSGRGCNALPIPGHVDRTIYRTALVWRWLTVADILRCNDVF